MGNETIKAFIGVTLKPGKVGKSCKVSPTHWTRHSCSTWSREAKLSYIKSELQIHFQKKTFIPFLSYDNGAVSDLYYWLLRFKRFWCGKCSVPLKGVPHCWSRLENYLYGFYIQYFRLSWPRCVRFAQSEKPLKRKGVLGKWIRMQIKMENFDSSRRTRNDYLPSHFRTGQRPTGVVQHQRKLGHRRGKHFEPEYGPRAILPFGSCSKKITLVGRTFSHHLISSFTLKK